MWHGSSSCFSSREKAWVCPPDDGPIVGPASCEFACTRASGETLETVGAGTRHEAVSGDTGEQEDEQDEQNEQDEQGEDWGAAGGDFRIKVRDSPPTR